MWIDWTEDAILFKLEKFVSLQKDTLCFSCDSDPKRVFGKVHNLVPRSFDIRFASKVRTNQITKRAN